MATVLLVDPDTVTAREYTAGLERAGFRVEWVLSSSERQNLVPDLLVISVARLERTLLRIVACGRPVPCIVLSSQPADSSRAAEFDCASVLIQPVMYAELVTQVRRVLKTSAADQPA